MSGPPLWAAQAQWLRGSPGLVRGHARVPGGSGVAAAVAAAVAARPQPRGRVPSLRRQQVGREPASAAAGAGAGRGGPGERARAGLPAGTVPWPPGFRGGVAAAPGTGTAQRWAGDWEKLPGTDCAMARMKRGWVTPW